jgi:hypothetical protein
MNMKRSALILAGVVAVALVAYPVMAKTDGCCGTAPKATTAPTTAPAYANTKCPMMDGKIDPAKVTPELTRVYKGQKVAFCCSGCPAAWDKLTDAEKDAKLAAAK